MSAKLKTIDLTGAVAGTQGTMDFNQFPKFNPQSMEKAHVRLMNESGAGLDIAFKQSGNTHFLPAGAWGTFDVEANDAAIAVTVSYVLPNPPVSMLIGLYYMPGEVVPQAFTLGNSPIGIGGSIATSNVSLSNENNADGLEVIDIGTESNPKLLDIFNDHFTWSVEQADVAHQVLKGQAAGNPLLIGQAGDISEVLGALTVDGVTVHTGATTQTGVLTAPAANVLGTAGNLQHILGTLTVDQATIISSTLEVTGDIDADSTITLANNIYLQVEDSGAVARGIVTVDATNKTSIRAAAAGGDIQFLDQNASVIGHFNSGGAGCVGQFNAPGGVKLTLNSLSAVATGTVSIAAVSAVVVNHGMAGIAAALLTTNQATSSGTNSAYSYTSTQFTAFNGANATLQYRWFAYNT